MLNVLTSQKVITPLHSPLSTLHSHLSTPYRLMFSENVYVCVIGTAVVPVP